MVVAIGCVAGALAALVWAASVMALLRRPAPPETVVVTVDGEDVAVPAGAGFGRRIYEAYGRDRLDGMMLANRAGLFVSDTTIVDLRGGECFVTVRYR